MLADLQCLHVNRDIQFASPKIEGILADILPKKRQIFLWPSEQISTEVNMLGAHVL